MAFITILIIAAVALGVVFYKPSKSWKSASKPFPKQWRVFLVEKVAFYNALSSPEKAEFERQVQAFILNHKVAGVSTTIDEEDKVLVAASAIIPIFRFPDWRYTNLTEVLIYPNSFNERFGVEGDRNTILGMVGTGYMNGKMILSREALHKGFSNTTDKRNTAIHEFVHLIDKMDGTIDGVPEVLMKNQAALPWISLIQEKMDEIHDDDSDINPYGGTSRSEFLPVVSEYFFERPKLLKKEHPKLYEALEQFFKHDMSDRSLQIKKQRVRRNSPCPCGSGKKFKHCCGRG